MTREDKYRILLDFKDGVGTREELIRKIGKDSYDEFCYVGTIKQGMDGRMEQRWQVTPFGRSQVDDYLALCQLDDNLDALCKQYGIITK